MSGEKIVNGVNTTALFNTIDAIKGEPVIAEFEFRADNIWRSGGHNHTSITDFYGANQVHVHSESFELDADEPPLPWVRTRDRIPWNTP